MKAKTLIVEPEHLPTSAWSPIKESSGYGLSGERLQLFDCFIEQLAYNFVCPAGRRALKTVIWLRLLVIAALQFEREYRDRHYCFCAPTEGQAVRIAWERLKSYSPNDRVKRVWEKDLCIEYNVGSELWLFGLDKPERIEGNEYDGVVSDESANLKPLIYESHVAPLVKDDGFTAHLGVFDYEGIGQESYEEKWEKSIHNVKTENGDLLVDNVTPAMNIARKTETKIDWIGFHWVSDDVMSQSKIKKLAQNMPRYLFLQEIKGARIKAPGLAYSDFSEKDHLRKVPFMKGKPIHAYCDFNYHFHNWGLLQVDYPQFLKGLSRFRIFDQVFLEDATVAKMCKQLKTQIRQEYGEEYLTTYGLLHFYGDYSGEQQRAEATYKAWEKIRAEFPNAVFHIQPQPPISDRIDLVNGVLKNHDGIVRVAIDGVKCPNLVRDFKFVSRKQLYTSSGKSGKLTHQSDGFGYFLDQYEELATIDIAKAQEFASQLGGGY